MRRSRGSRSGRLDPYCYSYPGPKLLFGYTTWHTCICGSLWPPRTFRGSLGQVQMALADLRRLARANDWTGLNLPCVVGDFLQQVIIWLPVLSQRLGNVDRSLGVFISLDCSLCFISSLCLWHRRSRSDHTLPQGSKRPSLRFSCVSSRSRQSACHFKRGLLGAKSREVNRYRTTDTKERLTIMPLVNVSLPVSQLPQSTSFFLSALQPLGYQYLGQRGDQQQIGFGVEEPDFFLYQERPGYAGPLPQRPWSRARTAAPWSLGIWASNWQS